MPNLHFSHKIASNFAFLGYDDFLTSALTKICLFSTLEVPSFHLRQKTLEWSVESNCYIKLFES